MINNSLVRQLIAINLLYINPSATRQARKKGKKGQKLSYSLIRQYVGLGVLFIVVYSMSMGMIDLPKRPGYFTKYVAFFGLLGVSQAVSAIFNVFFESRDLKDYVPLPIRQSEVFISKFFVVGLTIIPFILPLLGLFFLTSLKSGYFILWAAFEAVVLFCLFYLFLFSCCSFIVFEMARAKFFQRHKKLFSTFMLGLSMILSVVGVLLLNFSNNHASSQRMDSQPVNVFMPFFNMAHAPFSSRGALSFAGFVLLLAVLCYLVKSWIVPKLYQQLGDGEGQNFVAKRVHKGNRSLNQQLASYNFELIKNPNLMMQILTSSLVMPIVIIAMLFGIRGSLRFGAFPLGFMGVFFVGGLVFSMFLTTQSTFVGNLISLDRENFDFIRSLPVSLKHYLRQKFLFGLCLQIGLSSVLSFVLGVVLNLPLHFLVMFLLGNLLGTCLLSLHFFARDHRLLNLTWTNVLQLVMRGGGNFGLVVWYFGISIIGMFLIGGYSFAVFSHVVDPVVLHGCVAVLIIVGSIGLWWWNHQKFWAKFSD